MRHHNLRRANDPISQYPLLARIATLASQCSIGRGNVRSRDFDVVVMFDDTKIASEMAVRV